MSHILNEPLKTLLDDPHSVKIVSTTDETGAPYATASLFLQSYDDDRLVHLELLETSSTHRNLLRSLWFDRRVAVTVTSSGGWSTVLRGRPVKAFISGPVFRRYYEEIRSRLGDVDLAAVWLIEPDEVVNETFADRQQEEETKYPFGFHLDRLVVQA